MKAATGVSVLTTIDYRGYYKGEEIKKGEDNNTNLFIPQSDTSGNRTKDL
jgi:hypothetical protein